MFESRKSFSHSLLSVIRQCLLQDVVRASFDTKGHILRGRKVAKTCMRRTTSYTSCRKLCDNELTSEWFFFLFSLCPLLRPGHSPVTVRPQRDAPVLDGIPRLILPWSQPQPFPLFLILGQDSRGRAKNPVLVVTYIGQATGFLTPFELRCTLATSSINSTI